MKKFAPFALALALFAPSASAHFMFLEIDPETPEVVRLRFAEEILEATPRNMQELASGMEVSSPDGSSIELEYGEEFMSGAIEADVPYVTGTHDYGVLEREGSEPFFLKYHAKAARDAAGASSSTDLPVDVVASIKDGVMTITVLHNGKPYPGSELEVVLPHTVELKTVTTGKEGTVTLEVTTGDWVGIRAMVPEAKTGSHDGESYNSISHYSTLSFYYDEK